MMLILKILKIKKRLDITLNTPYIESEGGGKHVRQSEYGTIKSPEAQQRISSRLRRLVRRNPEAVGPGVKGKDGQIRNRLDYTPRKHFPKTPLTHGIEPEYNLIR